MGTICTVFPRTVPPTVAHQPPAGCIRLVLRAGCIRLVLCRGFFCSSTSTCGVSCVELTLLSLCLAASVSRAQTFEASPPRGPWTVVTFHHLFVKVNNAYVRFIAKSLPPFAASNNFVGKFAGCTLYRKQCLDFRRLVAGI